MACVFKELRMSKWMNIEEAAGYVGIGKTILYAMVKDGSIPANKVGQKWLIDSESLDGWIRANKPIEDFFIKTDFNISENPQLREPQLEAYIRLYDYFSCGNQKAIVQIPVGCGKSGLASLIPFGIAKGRVLVITPNLTITKGMLETLDITNHQKCFWRQRNVLKDVDMIGGPFACSLDTGNISVTDKSHIVVTNVHQLATNVDKWLTKFKHDYFDLIIIDEAHHSTAESWQTVLDYFPEAKVVNMTATPFRSDKAKIDGKLVFRYPFKRATLKGYVKQIQAWYVAPSELTFTAKGETNTYTLEEVLKLKEKDWFSRGIALSDICNVSIVNNSLQKLEELRETGTHHQLIAVACSIDHAKTIRSMYSERGYNADVIHSHMKKDEKDDVLRKLKSGELDCIIQIQMLGEGFDHQKLSVAAIFRPFRTLAPYIQFVGRVLRVIVQNNPTHPDNYGHIVTHSGMNLDQRLKEFKLFEKDDQRFWDEIIGGQAPEIPRDIKAGEKRLKNIETNIVNHEIADSLLGEDFTTADDEDLIQELADKLELLGLDPSSAREIYMTQQDNEIKISKAAQPFQIQPQNELKELRKRLQEKVNRSAGMLLNRLDLNRARRDLPNKGISANNNFTASIMLINKHVKSNNHKRRNDWTSEEFREAIESLDDILSSLTKHWKGILDDKKR